MVSVTSENIHVSTRIYDSGVSISWGRFFAWNETWSHFLLMAAWLVCIVLTLLLASHLVPVSIKRFVSILDNKAILHSNACGRSKLFVFDVVGFWTILYRFWWWSKSSFLGRGSGWRNTSSLTFDALFFSQLRWVLARSTIDLGCAGVASLIFNDYGIVWSELLGFKIEHTQVIQLFGQFENASEDVHFIPINYSWVTTAGYWFEITLSKVDWAPLFWFDVERPHIV